MVYDVLTKGERFPWKFLQVALNYSPTSCSRFEIMRPCVQCRIKAEMTSMHVVIIASTHL